MTRPEETLRDYVVLPGVPQADLAAHCRVNAQISQAIQARRRDVWESLVD